MKRSHYRIVADSEFPPSRKNENSKYALHRSQVCNSQRRTFDRFLTFFPPINPHAEANVNPLIWFEKYAIVIRYTEPMFIDLRDGIYNWRVLYIYTFFQVRKIYSLSCIAAKMKSICTHYIRAKLVRRPPPSSAREKENAFAST